MADNGLAQAIYDCVIEQFSMVPEELGPNVVVDPDDPATFPANSGEFKKQCLVDAAGDFIGFVGADGVHLEQDEQDDEVGPPITVAAGDEPPTTTEMGTNGPFECQKVLDENGNLIGMVGPSGYHPIAGDPVVIDAPADSNKITLTVEDQTLTLLSGLNKCGADGGPAGLDCDVDVVEVAGRVRQSRSIGIDQTCIHPDCFPTIEPKDQEGDTYHNDGVSFEFIDGAWVAVSVSPRGNWVAMNDAGAGNHQWTDADIAAAAATPNVWIDMGCIEEEYTNNDKVAHFIRWDVRAVAQFAAEAPGNLWAIRLNQNGTVGGSVNVGGQPGAPDARVNTTNGLQNDQAKYELYNWYYTRKVLPGESAKLVVCAQGTVVGANYVSNPANIMDVVGLAGRLTWERCC